MASSEPPSQSSWLSQSTERGRQALGERLAQKNSSLLHISVSPHFSSSPFGQSRIPSQSNTEGMHVAPSRQLKSLPEHCRGAFVDAGVDVVGVTLFSVAGVVFCSVGAAGLLSEDGTTGANVEDSVVMVAVMGDAGVLSVDGMSEADVEDSGVVVFGADAAVVALGAPSHSPGRRSKSSSATSLSKFPFQALITIENFDGRLFPSTARSVHSLGAWGSNVPDRPTGVPEVSTNVTFMAAYEFFFLW